MHGTSLDGQVAVVIGGASGIGLAIAKEFAREGCRVAIDRPQRRRPSGMAGEVAARGQDDEHRHRGRRDRLCRGAGRRRSRSKRRSASVQHVVYAAGCGSGKFGFPFWNLEPADWDRVLRVNLLGAVHTAHAFAPSLVEQKRGTMLFISSVAGQIGSQTDPPYSAAKAGLINFAQVAAKDLAPHNVRVNTICPGMVQTPLNRARLAGLERPPAAGPAANLRRVGRREGQANVPARPLANARGHRRPGRLSRQRPRRQHHRPDDERRWRLGDALVACPSIQRKGTSLAETAERTGNDFPLCGLCVPPRLCVKRERHRPVSRTTP